ncbi:hypothetical protein TSOC_011648 [Tetrabaena socialis]|uniref:Uncharacterized protein n=1 Tax=Tetrabaena socialis TaxID=47790 RepID=A0A2J7ZQ34_9CHLO|nr:hypothetical protein TSOC_011648 [Tetrabaena socialis]|eukprot:PNH02384.1 hypothetical protein TSOC_011648 [Tetrabaena socialis]
MAPRKGPNRGVWVILLLAQAVVAVAVVMLLHTRQAHPAVSLTASPTDRPGIIREGEHLSQQLDNWRRRATAAAVEVDQVLGLGGGSTPAASTTSATASATSATTAVAAASDATCQPNGHPVTTVAPINPAYLMRPAAEVEAENAEFAGLLGRHSNERREVMLGLANAVMICKNATLCWWNGGNILESFLEILERSNITNHLIGVTDEEAANGGVGG